MPTRHIAPLGIFLILTSHQAGAQRRPSKSTTHKVSVAVPTATSQGAYTAAQAGRGRQLYRANCSSCHAATAYTGATFRQLYVGRTAYDLVSLIRETMPNDDPGKLSAQQYVNIVAYLFQLNGYPPGTRALSVEDAALKRIAIDQAPEKSN